MAAVGLTGEGGEVLSEALEGWFDGESLRAFVSGAGRDQIAPVEQQVTLTVRLTRLAWLRAERVRFFIGDHAVGDAQVRRRELVRLPFRCDRPGLHTVGFEPVDGDGVPGRRAASARLHVVDRESPVAAVDAGCLLEEDLEMVEACRRLSADGWTLVYLDLADEPRVDFIRAAVARFGLPDGAVLAHPRETAEFDPLGVDFRPVLLAHSLRSIRAHGLALAFVVARPGAPWDLVEQESLPHYAPGEVVDRSTTARGRAALRAEAEALVAAWRGRQSGVAHRLDAMTAARAVGGNRFGVELDNRAARRRVLALIEGASTTIDVQFYIFEAGVFTDALVAALAARARAGVQVRLLVDAVYSREGLLGLENAALDRLRPVEGVQVIAVDPLPEPELVEPLSLRQRDHRKLLIVDGRLAIVSGRNAGDSYYVGFDEVPVDASTPHDRIPWFDAHVELEGPLVAHVAQAFLRNWYRNRGTECPEPMPTEGDAVGPSPGRLVIHDGVRDADGLGAYVALLDGAEQHVFIVNDFPVVSSLADAVVRALARGVRVVFLTGSAVPRTTEGRMLDGPVHRVLFEYMTKYQLEPLIEAGAEVYELCTPRLDNVDLPGRAFRPYVHAKVVSVDGRAASVGSANLDITASFWEREANVVIECPQVVGELEAALEVWRARSYRLEPEDPYWRAEQPQRALTARLWLDVLYPA